jgi:hypothetical protein
VPIIKPAQNTKYKSSTNDDDDDDNAMSDRVQEYTTVQYGVKGEE